jgi:hypothetical protein
MITQIITDQLNDLVLDTKTISGLVIMVFLVIHFFVNIKPAIASQRRIQRKVQRRLENDRANAIYYEKQKKQALKTGQKPPEKLTRRQNNNYYKKDKGYQAYLKRNTVHHDNKQAIKHERFKKVVASKNQLLSKTPRPNSGKMQGTFIGNLPLNRKPIMPRNLGPTNSFLER